MALTRIRFIFAWKMKKVSSHIKQFEEQGFCILQIELPKELRSNVLAENYEAIDHCFHRLLDRSGQLYELLYQFSPYDFSHIEHIISLRDAKNSWEEDGIWHDDGSRVLAFSLSLNHGHCEGGTLEFRRKGNTFSHKIKTPPYGHMIIFKTGIDGYEHKINRVTKGKRLIIAGWPYAQL